jgi:hypothetical protein
MVEYYYSNGNIKYGPYTIEELQLQELEPDTLVWHDKLSHWTRAADLPELKSKLIAKKLPPLPNITAYSNKNSYAASYNSARAVPNDSSPSFVVRVRRYRWVIIWCIFHLCALFLSYSEIKVFNDTGEPKTEKFWPFVKFTYPYFIPDSNRTYVRFNGFFTQYDWTEFSFYVGSVLFFIVLMHVYRKSA